MIEENMLRGSLVSSNEAKGGLGFKGERGYSAYEIAVQHGFEGTEEDWLATLGTSSHFSKDVAVYTTTESTTEFNTPITVATGDFVDVYVNGFKLNENEYTFNTTKVILTNAILSGNVVEVIVNRMSTNNLPISTTITSSSTNDTASGTKSVYDALQTKIDKTSISTTIDSTSTNSTIPTSKAVYDKTLDEYSTTEQVIGTWIDGKPIYRQVFENEGTMVTNQWGRGIPGNVYNVDTLVNGYFIDKPSKAVWEDTNVKIDENTIKYFSANWSHAYSHVVIEYTKTTD